ncbi:MAG: membrane protein [Gemmatimonadota bacterium]
MERTFFALGSVLALLGVAAGAFGTHGLRGTISAQDLATFDTAVRYQLIHALALLATAWAATRWPGASVQAAGWLFVVGTVVFSGSLYVLVLAGQRWMGAVTPLGGVCFLLGWGLLAWSAFRGG